MSQMAQVGSKKSRKGCNRCKQRRVKCDEEAPCNNCVRRNEECSLLEPKPSKSDVAREPGVPMDTAEWLSDLELIHHYVTNASVLTSGTRPEVQQIWGNYIPQQAFKHPFLMHGILALSALHMAYLQDYRSPNHLQLCDKHQAIALNKFRSILATDINNDVADALFALAATLAISSMARACASSEASTPKAMTMDDIAEYCFLTRGIRDVIELTYHSIHQGPLSLLFDAHKMPDGTDIVLNPEVTTQFEAVDHMLTTLNLDPEALKHCQTALNHLHEIYRNVQYFANLQESGEVYSGQVMRWIVMFDSGYVRLVQARNQPALVIFAYFATVTSAVRTAWYIQDWGRYALRGISMELEAGMLKWMDWPTRQFEARMEVLRVRPSKEEANIVKPTFETGQD